MNYFLDLKYKKAVMQATITIVITDGAKIIIVELTKKYTTNICFCVLLISKHSITLKF